MVGLSLLLFQAAQQRHPYTIPCLTLTLDVFLSLPLQVITPHCTLHFL